MSNIGHNSNRVGGVAVEELKTIIGRIEKLTEEKQAIQGDITDVYGEAKGRGFDTRAIKAIIKLRKISESDRVEQETILDVYKHALGMIGDEE